MSENKWWEADTLEGRSLILGPGFDFEAMITVEVASNIVIFKSPYPSKEGDENYPYPNMMEIGVPLDQIKNLLRDK
jgi:hypothetical protein